MRRQKTIERHYIVTVKFKEGKRQEGWNPHFSFWLNEPLELHDQYLWQMLKAAACERYQLPFIDSAQNREDFMGVMDTFTVRVLREME